MQILVVVLVARLPEVSIEGANPFFFSKDAVDNLRISVRQVQYSSCLVTRKVELCYHDEELEAHIIRNINLRLARFTSIGLRA